MCLSNSNSKKIILMDICTIGYLKDKENILSGNDERKKKIIRELSKEIENKENKFSFILAILEKGTDYTHTLSKDELLERFFSDYTAISKIIPEENIVESKALIELLITTLIDPNYPMRERAELSIPENLKFLSYFNSLKICSTPPRKERFELAQQVAKAADAFKVQKGYLTILVCIASIYGCDPARKILKIKKNGNDFNPSNCLGDIMSITRAAKARALILKKYPQYTVEYRTEDQALENFHKYICAKHILNAKDLDRFTISITNQAGMFPALYRENQCIDDEELKKLYSLLDFSVDC